MICTQAEVLREATHLAVCMVDQIEWIDLFDMPDTPTGDQITVRMKEPRQRDRLKRIIEQTAAKIEASPLLVEWLHPESLIVAAQFVARAIKALIVTENPNNKWIASLRLGIKFTEIPGPWVQPEESSLDIFTTPQRTN